MGIRPPKSNTERRISNERNCHLSLTPMDVQEEEAPQIGTTRAAHIKKRSLKNKALSVTFNEKELKDFVTGFHKRKKKRRKEARQQQQEAERRKRIENRKKRKLEKEFALYGGPLPKDTEEPDGEDHEQDEGSDQDEESDSIPPVSDTTMYDTGEYKVTVTTSEISREEDIEQHPRSRTTELEPAPGLIAGANKKTRSIPVNKKKPFKKVVSKRSRPKLQKKRDRKKGKINSSNNKRC